nr:unnamed protein product [Fasciola hepatica]
MKSFILLIVILCVLHSQLAGGEKKAEGGEKKAEVSDTTGGTSRLTNHIVLLAFFLKFVGEEQLLSEEAIRGGLFISRACVSPLRHPTPFRWDWNHPVRFVQMLSPMTARNYIYLEATFCRVSKGKNSQSQRFCRCTPPSAIRPFMLAPAIVCPID